MLQINSFVSGALFVTAIGLACLALGVKLAVGIPIGLLWIASITSLALAFIFGDGETLAEVKKWFL